MALGGTHNVGCYVLANATITVPLTTAVQNTVNNLDGMQAVTALCYFNYGSAGTNANAHVQTTFDGGTTWLDICDFTFTTSSATVYANLSGVVAQGTTAYSALSSQTVNPALLGSQLRAYLTTTGTYATTTCQVYVAVR